MDSLFGPETVVIVTGSSSGIGAATVVKFAQKGVNRFCLTGRNQQGILDTQQKLNSVNPKADCVAVTGDITLNETCEKIVSTSLDKFGRIDILVNNAGVSAMGSIREAPVEQFDNVFGVNVKSAIMLTKLCLPHLEKTKGSVVNISSISSLKSFTNSAYYSMSKAALDMFTKTLAAEEGKNGIRVNSVNPGVIDTGIHVKAGLPRELVDYLLSNHSNPMGRIGKEEEIASSIVYLSSKEASFVTGAILSVDGGLSCHHPI